MAVQAAGGDLQEKPGLFYRLGQLSQAAEMHAQALDIRLRVRGQQVRVCVAWHRATDVHRHCPACTGT